MQKKLYLYPFYIVFSTTLLYTSAKTTEKKVEVEHAEQKQNIQINVTSPQIEDIDLSTPVSPEAKQKGAKILKLPCHPKACVYCPENCCCSEDLYGCWKEQGYEYNSTCTICINPILQIACFPLCSIGYLANVISMKYRKKGRTC